MNKAIPFAIAATFVTLGFFPQAVFAAETNQDVRAVAATAGTSGAVARVGQMIYGPDGKRIASVYRVRSDGTAQVILNGKLVSIPATVIARVDNKLVSSISSAELGRR